MSGGPVIVTSGSQNVSRETKVNKKTESNNVRQLKTVIFMN